MNNTRALVQQALLNQLGILKLFCINESMSPWIELTEANLVQEIPIGVLGVFQLSKDGDRISYVGRSDSDLQEEIKKFLSKDYKYFQWVQLPWTKETYEMHCRLYHHAGGKSHLDNIDHPYSTNNKQNFCPLSLQPSSMCEF